MDSLTCTVRMLCVTDCDGCFGRSCERNEPIWTAFKLDDLLSSGNLQPSGQFQRIDIDSTLNVVRDVSMYVHINTCHKNVCIHCK